MERKLASIQKIKSVEPIPNADAIEKITVLGWQCVAKKGEFKPGDMCVYVEIDSILPAGNPYFAFMESKNYRVKTVKLRGQISQGICFPVDIVKNVYIEDALMFSKAKYLSEIEGLDVTNILNIIKYEPPAIHTSQETKGNFPNFLFKTDETRVQNIEKVIAKYQGTKFYVTEKLDGTSMTVYVRNGECGVCSRNLELKLDQDNKYTQTAKKYDLFEKLKKYNEYTGQNFAIQGELVGPGIQQNKYQLKELHFFVFNVFNIDTMSYIDYKDFISITYHDLSIEIVPEILFDGLTSYYELNHTAQELIQLSIGKSVLNPVIQREGLVFRPLEEIQDDYLGRLSFKAINPEFLLKYGE